MRSGSYLQRDVRPQQWQRVPCPWGTWHREGRSWVWIICRLCYLFSNLTPFFRSQLSGHSEHRKLYNRVVYALGNSPYKWHPVLQQDVWVTLYQEGHMGMYLRVKPAASSKHQCIMNWFTCPMGCLEAGRNFTDYPMPVLSHQLCLSVDCM